MAAPVPRAAQKALPPVEAALTRLVEQSERYARQMDLRWVSPIAGLYGELVSLQHRSVEIARLWERLDGQWFVDLDRHLDQERWRTRQCSSLEAGRNGCVLWAERHQERIELEVDGQLRAWRAQQKYLGPSRGV